MNKVFAAFKERISQCRLKGKKTVKHSLSHTQLSCELSVGPY